MLSDRAHMNFNEWLVSTLLFEFLNCVLLLTLCFAPSLKEALAALPLLQRLRFLRACSLLSVMGSPPPLIVPDSSLCEFPGRLRCTKRIVSETTCCGIRRCQEHGQTHFCCLWLLQASKERRAAHEPLLPKSKLDCVKWPRNHLIFLVANVWNSVLSTWWNL